MNNLRVVLLEDNPDDASLLLLELRQAGLEIEPILVKNEADYLRQLNPQTDLILSDYTLPGFDALTALEILKARTDLDIPFIIVSGTISEEAAVESMKRGSTDYLLKDRLSRLGHAVKQALHEKALRQRAHLLEQQELDQRKLTAALYESLRAMSSSLSFDVMLHSVLDNVGLVVPHDKATFMLLEGMTLRVVDWRGYPETSSAILKDIHFSVDHPLIHPLLETGEPRLIANTLDAPTWSQVLGLETVRSNLAVALRSRNAVVGILNLDSDQPSAFTPQHADWLSIYP